MTTDVWDFYQQCEDAFATRAQTLSTFFGKSKQVSDDDSVLSEGADYWLIYRPGAFPIVDNLLTQKIMDVDWNITVDMYVRYKTYKESWGKFRRFRAALFFLLHSDQHLGGEHGISRVTFSSNEAAQYFRYANSPEEAKPNFIIQTGNVVVRQRVRFDKTVFSV